MQTEQKERKVRVSLKSRFINHFKKVDYHSESAEALTMAIPCRERHKSVFENQKCVEVSLACIYNGFLILKTEKKSLSKIVTFLTSAISPPPIPLTSNRR